MNINIFLQLGRISNLPTIWTNCLTGAFLSNNFILDYRFFWLLAGISLLYVSGMFLNDAFDFEFDKRYRPARPVVSGNISVSTVFTWSFLVMLLGLSFILIASNWQIESNGFLAALCLSILIVIYDWKHKNNPLAPIIMGVCRSMVPITVGLAYSASINLQLTIGALFIFSWTVGLTLLARQEHLDNKLQKWPLLFLLTPLIYITTTTTMTLSLLVWLFLGILFLIIVYILTLTFSQKPINKIQLILLIIASFSLLDGLLLAANGFESAAILAGSMFPVTLQLQKSIAGT